MLVALTTDDDDEAVDDATEGIVVDVAPPVPIDADVDDEGVGCALIWEIKKKLKKTALNIPLCNEDKLMHLVLNLLDMKSNC